jgi:hypothetical protein
MFLAAFDYQFKAIDEGGTGTLSKVYNNLLSLFSPHDAAYMLI